jgi:hypothetical protein
VEQKSRDIVNKLNCKLEELSMTYLGIPLSDNKLGMGAFMGLTERIAKKIPPGKGSMPLLAVGLYCPIVV